MQLKLAFSRPLVIAVAIGAALLLGILYWIGRGSVHAPPSSLAPLTLTRPPKPAASVAFQGADGKIHALGDFKGKLVLLNLWAPWCAPCVKELPALAALQTAIPKDRFVVIPVDVGRDRIADASQFLNGHGASVLPAYLDSNISAFSAYGAYGLPTTILIDGKGREIARAVGPADWSAPDSIAYMKRLAGS